MGFEFFDGLGKAVSRFGVVFGQGELGSQGDPGIEPVFGDAIEVVGVCGDADEVEPVLGKFAEFGVVFGVFVHAEDEARFSVEDEVSVVGELDGLGSLCGEGGQETEGSDPDGEPMRSFDRLFGVFSIHLQAPRKRQG